MNDLEYRGSLAFYGMFRSHPNWYVRIRGFYWLRHGFCPCCYSSPPLAQCPVCFGDSHYGNMISATNLIMWRQRWVDRCAHYATR